MELKIFDIFEDLFFKVKSKKPLVHHITNYVTSNDCATMTLAIGASPVMASAEEEVEDFVNIADSLVLNIGTINKQVFKSILIAGEYANKIKIPVIFDPVGVGASNFRNKITLEIINKIKLSIIKANISEIKFIAGQKSEPKGVDASVQDNLNINNTVNLAKNLSKKLDSIIVISGAVDIISDGNKAICIENGSEFLTRITGSGCMCASLIGSFCAVAEKKEYIYAAALAMICMGVAGEIAYEKSKKYDYGLGSFHAKLHDAISIIDTKILKKLAKYHEF